VLGAGACPARLFSVESGKRVVAVDAAIRCPERVEWPTIALLGAGYPGTGTQVQTSLHVQTPPPPPVLVVLAPPPPPVLVVLDDSVVEDGVVDEGAAVVVLDDSVVEDGVVDEGADGVEVLGLGRQPAAANMAAAASPVPRKPRRDVRRFDGRLVIGTILGGSELPSSQTRVSLKRGLGGVI
jgi:hypothetical protein